MRNTSVESKQSKSDKNIFVPMAFPIHFLGSRLTDNMVSDTTCNDPVPHVTGVSVHSVLVPGSIASTHST